MIVHSSNKQDFYFCTLRSCTCPDFTFRNKLEISKTCEIPYCQKCTCKHIRENLDLLLIEESKK